jgi:hypothetical protein
MSVWLDKIGRRSVGSHRPSGWTTVRPKFWKFRWKSFLFKSRVHTVFPCLPNARTSTASNFPIEASRIRTRRMVVRTVDLMHTISISKAHASGLWWLASGRLDLNCDTCLIDLVRPEGESTSFGRLQQSSHICVLERNPEAWSNTECRPDRLLKRPDGCKLEQFEASRHRGRSGRKFLVV